MTLQYLSGFGNGFESEARKGALPIGRNSPQRCPLGLYAEQISGSPFTAPRVTNERSWLYRIFPTVKHWGQFKPHTLPLWLSAPVAAVNMPPQPLRWSPLSFPQEKLNFIEGIRTITTCGDVGAQAGVAMHLYYANRDMVDEYFYNADGEIMVMPQAGELHIYTEFGIMLVSVGELAVLPRGVKFRVSLVDGEPSNGYICENYGGVFTLPERGLIGANCLANQRDFYYPTAAFEDIERKSQMVVKYNGVFWAADLARSPLDVVAWHGNYAPYKYDMRRFSPLGPMLFDHADPSIFTCLTSPSETQGTANADFVIFGDRWLVAENTFRPPWYHMNIMSEFMGLIYGQYDAKPQGFKPGGFSLHNSMLPHGPDTEAFEKASAAELKPHKLENTLAFMVETRLPQRITPFAFGLNELQHDYVNCWQDLKKNYK